VPVFMRGVQGRQQMARMLDALRADPPREVAGLEVTGSEDLRDPAGKFGPLKGGTDAASRNVLLFRFGDRARIALRPSGTEPKAKIYLEASSPPCPAGTDAAAWRRTCDEVNDLVKRLSADFVRQALGRVGLDPASAGAG
jgi:phosphoglucomutase/phosphomannomutase